MHTFRGGEVMGGRSVLFSYENDNSYEVHNGNI
jgi:hypothetical protein